MDDVTRRDQVLFIREFLTVSRMVSSFAIAFFLGFVTSHITDANLGLAAVGIWLVPTLAFSAWCAWVESQKKRFSNPNHRALWSGCEDRLKRFREAIRNLRKNKIADFEELPKAIDSVGASLYLALRRADMVSGEISRSEGWLQSKPPSFRGIASTDPQATELYRIADKNIAEYRQNYSAVVASVQRTEAQAAVFMTTLDTLRLKMLGYRLTCRKPELSSKEFLEAMSEAKLQLQAIDKALDELELGPFPTMIAAMPPPIPEEAVVQQRVDGGSE